ncbi:uncharacterized protein LOC110331267 [Mus pahari]|uniref:uncharacterized protein LOC110331267 n=1 Tax=Mus pahari TaxID=10093 RepID=UPI000A3049B5|nr:uncharacterized protein LOC110331267 [Mus pahari]
MGDGSRETRTTTSRRGERRDTGRDERRHTPEDPAAQPGTLSLPGLASRLCPRPKARGARPLLAGLRRTAGQEVICSPPKSASSSLSLGELVLNSLFQETSAFALPCDIRAQLDSPCSGTPRVFPISEIQPSVLCSLLEFSLPHPK